MQNQKLTLDIGLRRTFQWGLVVSEVVCQSLGLPSCSNTASFSICEDAVWWTQPRRVGQEEPLVIPYCCNCFPYLCRLSATPATAIPAGTWCYSPHPHARLLEDVQISTIDPRQAVKKNVDEKCVLATNLVSTRCCKLFAVISRPSLPSAIDPPTDTTAFAPLLSTTSSRQPRPNKTTLSFLH